MAFNKFKSGTTGAPEAGVTKAKPRGGWEDDDDDNQPQIRTSNTGTFRGNQPAQPSVNKDTIKSPHSSSSNQSDDITPVSGNKKFNPAIDFEIIQIDEKFLASHEHENKTINDLIQPGGARVKQSDAVLNNFCKACESFQVAVAGSLLLSKLYEDIPYVSKARDLFLIEAVVKKVKKYFDYFKHNLTILKDVDYSNEGQNAAQLNKITEDIVKYIENPNKPKPVNLIPVTTTTTQPTPSISANILDEPDLLGGGPGKGKQDPFAFIKKQSSDSTQSQSFGGTDLLDMQPTSQSFSNQQQPFISQNQPLNQQQQTQAKKFNPFELPSSQAQNVAQPQSQPQIQTQSQPQNTAQQSSGLNFKKFQSSNSFSEQKPTTPPTQSANPPQMTVTTTNLQQNVKEPQQTSPLDQLDDLLENFTGLDFSGNKVESSSNQGVANKGNTYGQGNNFNNQNTQGMNQFGQGPSPQNQGFSGNQNQGFSGNLATQNQQGSFQQNQGFSGSQPQGGFMGTQMQGQFNPQLHPQQFGGSGPYQGYPPNAYWGRGYPQQGFPQQGFPQQGFQQQPQGYYPNPNYGYGQAQQGGYPNQQFGGVQGQPGMYGNVPQQGQPNTFNPSQNQFGMPNRK